ncbi:MAG: respiratory nitrate reductase subunit gamma [Candidatus Accumulibacter phosphatis]|uniref:nitrate reductase (quinone) n=1 Tax=Candidatus Accumulibacter phosphatis TaxID=327160 RepID=A0A5S4EMN4_9PROT|nr:MULTISPECIES: respiratory nitrate reductase subunit gamma [Candidatus Accumulibacter]MBN8516504.1 respiratory nitrate reductase subunit gamma [Accumulibacter sp.]MBO3713289.1 respiratory nitrate reductase subunit gamma [Accumulibacter sp.]MCQ1551190.1 respiratory nitrate reductase subunit gamma [Candidatus Accumulibacter phosphatis]TMQ76632.1 Respiratory nitrate reductase gamma chain [Candidatus Accumulibacter phosphatis]
MNTLQAYAHNLFFNVYPYLCLAVFLMGSLARFDRDQYTWKSDSSQMLRAGTLRWGSNLFHIGILFLLMGHTIGLLTPHWLYEPFISPERKQVVAVVAGGIAGVVCFIGLTLLLHRRLSDPRIRLTSHRTDLAILIILWVQLTIGLITLPYSFGHEDASVMLALSDWAQRIVTFRPDAAGLVPLAWPYKIHLVLGMTIFLLLPFSRLVHVWSGFASLAYVFRPYQLVRSRRLNLPGGHNTPTARH